MLVAPRYIDVRYASHAHGDQHLGEEEQEIGHLVQGHHSQYVSHQKIKRIFGTGAKVLSVDRAHNVRIPIDELEELLQHPEEAFHAAENRPGERIIELFQLVIDILEDTANYPANCHNQGAKRQRA